MYKRHNITLTSASLVRIRRTGMCIAPLDQATLTCCKRNLSRWHESRSKSTGLTKITFRCLHCGSYVHEYTDKPVGLTREA